MPQTAHATHLYLQPYILSTTAAVLLLQILISSQPIKTTARQTSCITDDLLDISTLSFCQALGT